MSRPRPIKNLSRMTINMPDTGLGCSKKDKANSVQMQIYKLSMKIAT